MFNHESIETKAIHITDLEVIQLKILTGSKHMIASITTNLQLRPFLV